MIVVVGAGVQFGFSAWSSLPGRYSKRVFPEDIATATGFMLTAGGIGGFVIPALFGVLQASNGYAVAFLVAGLASIAFALIDFAAREPAPSSPALSPLQQGEQQQTLSEHA